MAPEDCDTLRDETIMACVKGFEAKVDVPDGRSMKFQFALHGVCPYAGAIAWSGCHRGALERFRGRNAAGACGDRADFIESAIETSCTRPSGLPLDEWNHLVKECFEWAETGSKHYTMNCLARTSEPGTSPVTPWHATTPSSRAAR
jgi:hypothetical protein